MGHPFIVRKWFLALWGLMALILGPAGLAAGVPKVESELTVVATTALELKAILTQAIRLPFLVGEGSLLKDNNIQFKLGEELTPVDANATLDITWTPIAFLQVMAGASIGSGWDIGFAHGLSLNQRSGLHDNYLDVTPFQALMWKVKFGAAFQFDAAAIAPGDWNHVVFRTYHEFYYRGLAGVPNDVSWLYEADVGENRNGWNYYGNYFVGYQMPIVLDMIGLLLESDLFLYTTPGRQAWGDDLIRWNFGPVIDFRLSKQTTLAILAQWKTQRNFLAGSESYGFYQDRLINNSDPLRLIFNRVGLVLDVKF